MPTLFHNIPRDGETVAAVRRRCAARGFPADCTDPCRRARRCRGAWLEVDGCKDLVLPPCLAARSDAAYGRLAEAQVELTALRRILAEARGLPNPGYLAEFDEFDEDAAADADDDAPWR